MTDPQRLSQASTGLAAELLRAGAEEQPNDLGMQQTLLALGLSGVVLSTTSAASAAAAGGAKLTGAVSAGAGAGGVGLASAGSIKAISATLVIKWLGIGVLGGVGLASVAAVTTGSSAPPRTVSHVSSLVPQVDRAVLAPTPRESQPATVETPASVDSKGPTLSASAVPVSAHGPVVSRPTEPTPDVGIPLAAEVAYVDQARALLAIGRSTQGLALLEHYEQKFPEARLLPEVLFLQLEAYERVAQSANARNAAQRLVDGFPKSPHAGRARKLLSQ